MNYSWDQFHKDLKTLQTAWVQWFNGYHMEPRDWEEFSRAVERLQAIIPKEKS